MVTATTFSRVLLAAPLLAGSHAFHTVGTSSLASRSPQNELQTLLATTRSPSSPRTPKIVLHESSDGENEAASETKNDDENDTDKTAATAVATNTINERLMAELKAAEQTEKFGSKGKTMSLVDGYGRPRKTDAEIQQAIAEARDLNGVNPIVAIVGSFFAFGVAAALWVATNKLGGYFALHPPETEVYFVLRSAQVFRNVVMGMISLASGFFGVTGLGIFGMGVRVAYGVMTGELDPTPIKTKTPTKETVDLGNMMDLMMNKKPGRRGGGKK